MAIDARYVHTNIVARDWRELARFYERVFGCVPIPPERDLAGRWLDRATGIPGIRLRGMHMRLPGYGGEGPTLEIFQYDGCGDEGGKSVDRHGFAHISFMVDDVGEARRAVIEAGGGGVGDTVTLEVPGAGEITFAYVTDPEGNIIELQRWS